jgi:predicted PurR-regulated permease PerM
MKDVSGRFERGGFLLLLTLVTLALLFVAWPFASALLWATLAAIMFQPLYQWMLVRSRGRENRAAIGSLLVITVAVILPILAIASVVFDEASRIYLAVQARQIDASAAFQQIQSYLPLRLRQMIEAAGYGDFAVLEARLSQLIRESLGLVAQYAVTIGGSAFSFVVTFVVGLYVTYFLLRDGRKLGSAIQTALPLERSIAERLGGRFTAIVRATIKGSIIVGIAQGALGALTFWVVGMPSAILFGVLMAILSLLPAVGPAVLWVPVAIYLLVTGAIWQAVVVVVSGVLLIGMIDNVLRPILVGRDTGIPDWIILITTLGGIASFGLSGIVIGPLVAGLFLASWSVLNDQRGLVPEARTEESKTRADSQRA